MRVLFLGLNYAPEEIGIAVYTTGLCEDLAEMGHDVRVIAAQPYYPSWKVFPSHRGWWRRTTENGVDLTRCPIYVPNNPTGPKRMIHHVTFALSAFLPLMKAAIGFKPDLVMTAAPSLIGAPIAWLAAKLSGAAKWLHIQDFEVEAAFATGLLSDASGAARLARRFERGIIRHFDQVSSISPEMCGKIAAFGVPEHRVYEFRNWAEIDRIIPLAGTSPYHAQWNLTTPHVALYSGNIANKQGIEIVVDAARRLANRDDLTFVICGEGPNRAKLEKEAEGLSNIQFRDLQPRERLGELLGLATIHLLPQQANTADLVLPSKLTNMLASGRPAVVTAAPDTGLAREVEGCCLVTTPGDSAALADAIERLIEDPELHGQLSRASRARAETVWHRQHIIGAVERVMRVVVGTRAMPSDEPAPRVSVEGADAMTLDLAPVAVFAYNRRDHVEALLTSLERCEGFERTPVTIFVDGPRREDDRAPVEEVRDFVRALAHRNVRYRISEGNNGLRKSLYAGVSRIVAEHDRVIVLEDDLVLSPIALTWFNGALDRYAEDLRVWSVSGYVSDVPALREFPRALILPYAHSWGWATWGRAWRHFDLDAKPRDENLHAGSFRQTIDMNGFYPFRDMLRHSIAGRINSWYAHWLYTIVRNGGRSVFPPRRVLDNYGISAGTHGGSLNPHELLVQRPPLLERVPAFEDPGEIDYFAADMLKRCWEARVQRGVAFAGAFKRRLLGSH